MYYRKGVNMLGAIIGDISGSMYEGGWDRIKTKDFPFFGGKCRYTDDTVCTAAVADIILHDLPPVDTMRMWCQRHPGRGYGGNFRHWIVMENPKPFI